MCKKAESLDFCINDINKESIRILDEYNIPYTAKLICIPSEDHQEPIFTTNTFDKSIIVDALFNDKDSYLKALSILNEHNRGDEDPKPETSKSKVDFEETCDNMHKIIKHQELKRARNTILLYVVDIAIKVAINIVISRIVRGIIKKYKKEK